jgi:hypothetical protein
LIRSHDALVHGVTQAGPNHDKSISGNRTRRSSGG